MGLRSEVEKLERRVYQLEFNNENPFIGEIYVCSETISTSPGYHYFGGVRTVYKHPSVTKHCEWVKFREKDVAEDFEDHVKIKGVWLDRKEVIYYNSVFKIMKEGIAEKYEAPSLFRVAPITKNQRRKKRKKKK